MSYQGSTKRCSKCRAEKPLSEFYPERRRQNGYQSACKICDFQRRQQYRQANKDKIKIWARAANWKVRGLDFDHARYEELRKSQNGVCGICRKSCTTGRALSVDHDHTTGKIR